MTRMTGDYHVRQDGCEIGVVVRIDCALVLASYLGEGAMVLLHGSSRFVLWTEGSEVDVEDGIATEDIEAAKQIVKNRVEKFCRITP